MSGETLLQSWDGWDYYSGGTVVGPDGTYYSEGQAVWSPPSLESVAASQSSGDAWASGLLGLAGKGLDVWAQQNAQGDVYREGQARRTAGVPISQNNMLLLLIGAGVLFVMSKA